MYAPEQDRGILSKLDVDIQKAVPSKPELTKEICLQDSRSLQHFLKLSRYAVDDNLKSHLNSLLNHNETSEQSIFRYIKSDTTKTGCDGFIKSIVYPEWQKRIDVIKFCQEQVTLSMDAKFDDDEFTSLSTEEKHKMMRIDPYTYKNLEQKYLRKNSQMIGLQNLYNNEAEIESIITQRSTELFAEQCKLRTADIKQSFIDYMQSVSNQ